MLSRERLLLLLILVLISVIIAIDLLEDANESVSMFHILTEGAAGILALTGIAFLLLNLTRLRRELKNKVQQVSDLSLATEQWRSRSKHLLDGLSVLIDQQLADWKLTPAEREVAFLLLKGLSSKEIAICRGTTEKTVRVQAAMIYAKSNLPGRSALSAFFLEDLLPGNQNSIEKQSDNAEGVE